MADERWFVATETAFVLDAPDGKRKQQLLWGDYVRRDSRSEGPWVRVRGRGEDGWMRAEELQREQLLEVCFVDIGQGDGTLVVTPQDEFLLIDAGERDNMCRFLSWRFNLRKNPDRVIRFKAAVISHPDLDHYGGFQPIFASEQFAFETLYHNGIVERAGSEPLGARVRHEDRWYLTSVCTHQAQVAAVVNDPVLRGRKKYPSLLQAALQEGRVGRFHGASTRDGHIAGFGPDDPVTISVLGPAVANVDGADALPWFDSSSSSTGKTKNGHSVVLMLTYGSVRILLGGDVNSASERYLLTHHTGLDPHQAAREDVVARGRAIFECDVAKACHHGSSDFTTEFLECLNPVATVISSGDDESHCHPRPDTLGAIGKASRGERPLIFSTELARSSRETIRRPDELRQSIRELAERISEAADEATRAALNTKLDKQLAAIERSVAVYGMITLRTDGTKVLMAQKLEAPRPNGQEFDTQFLVPDSAGRLVYRL